MPLSRSLTRMVIIGAAVFGLLFGGAGRARADVIYAATGSNGVNGTLVILDPNTGGVMSTVGPLVDASGNAYGLTGLAFHPTTGVLYGSTANLSPTLGRNLVTVNPATGLVTPIGPFGNPPVSGTLSDISFRSDGTLFGWEASGDHELHTVNLGTGQATSLGSDIPSLFGGGGIAVRADGTIFITPDGVTGPGTLRTINPATGVTTIIGPLGLQGDPINALDFDSTGTLYGIVTDRGIPANTLLVTINQTTGLVTPIGASLDDLDALAILREPQEIPEPTTLTLFTLLGIGGAGYGYRRWRGQVVPF